MSQDNLPSHDDLQLGKNKYFLFMYGAVGLGVTIWLLMVVMNIFVLSRYMSIVELIITVIFLMAVGYFIAYYKGRSGQLGLLLRRYKARMGAYPKQRILFSSLLGAIVMLGLSYLFKLFWTKGVPIHFSTSIIAFAAFLVIFYLWQLWTIFLVRKFIRD